MANLHLVPKKMSNTKLKLSDLNPHLMCVLCGGYYIDATTIVECLHSFCRSCIVKHLESSKYCPICEVQVHKTKPLINIRPDKTLQDIVYKLVPGLFANEMQSRRKFYKERPHYIKPYDSESAGELYGERKIYVNDENITFSLVYHEGPGPTAVEDSYREFPPPENNERRYFKCPTGVTVQHLKKLVRAKYELNDNNYKLEIYFRDQELHEDFTLLDIAYIYLWKAKGSLDLTYKIFENVVKRQKIEENPEKAVMRQADATIADVTEKEEKVEKEEKTEAVRKEKEEVGEQKLEAVPKEPETKEPEPVNIPPKENGVTPGTEVKEVQLQISESGVMSVSQVEDSRIVKTVEETAAKVTNNQIVTGVPGKEVQPGKGEAKPPPPPPLPPPPPPEKKAGGGKPAKPYKTIRCSPKTWHPVIPKEKLRPTLMKNSDEPRKPLKFFKMRNMPRYLGNPSSGVKPMFAGAADKQGEKKPEVGKTANKILKIDPKTLRPIEKEEIKVISTPNTPNLLTNPFIPNNNHFLFSDLQLLPPNSGNYKEKPAAAGGFKAPVPNGTYPPICFPTPEQSSQGYYPFGNLTKPQTFPFPPADKMDPLLRASRLSPFGNLAGFNVDGFHANLPPSISRLINPHHHFRKLNQTLEKKNKEESTKETTKRCDDSLKVSKGEGGEETSPVAEGEGQKKKKEETTTGEGEGEEKKKESGEGGQKEVNGETSKSASDRKSDSSASVEEKEKEKDKDR